LTARRIPLLRCSVSILLACVLAAPAFAHLQRLQGHLVELTQRSALIVIASVQRVRGSGTSRAEVTATVLSTLHGDTVNGTLIFGSPSGLAAGDRCVVFLTRQGAAWENAAPSGALFLVKPDDDTVYRKLIAGLDAALARPAAQRPDALRAALISVLSAANDTLRYDAGLELVALASDGHGPDSKEREELQRLSAAKDFDPALRPLVEGLLRQEGTSPAARRAPAVP
jgi:hypothetical protein